MATKTITTTELIDDLDGTKAERTISYTFDGTSYEIDLSKKNSTALMKAMKPYLAASRVVRANRSSPARKRKPQSQAKTPAHLAAVRAWARDNGYEIADRGRISQAIQLAYAESNA